MAEPIVIGVDVGATKVLVGAVTRQGKIRASHRSRMDGESKTTTVRSIEGAITDFMDKC